MSYLMRSFYFLITLMGLLLSCTKAGGDDTGGLNQGNVNPDSSSGYVFNFVNSKGKAVEAVKVII